jgi:hypothetical protein
MSGCVDCDDPIADPRLVALAEAQGRPDELALIAEMDRRLDDMTASDNERTVFWWWFSWDDEARHEVVLLLRLRLWTEEKARERRAPIDESASGELVRRLDAAHAVARRSTESGAPVVGDPCPLCNTPLPDMWEGVRECDFCGWQEWQPYETPEMHARHLRSRR